MTGYLVVIIGMEGLSDFQHHIIGSIYHIIDGADTIAAKSVFYPFRRTSDFYVFQKASTEAFAVGRFGNVNGSTAFDRRPFFFYGNGWQGDFLPENGTGFQSHADHAEAVGSVGGEFHFIHHIVQVVQAMNIHAYRCIFRKDKDTIMVESREKIGIHAQFT